MSRVASRIVRRGGVFQFRRRVPDDVRRLGGFGGKEILQVSLRTSDPLVARREAVKQEELFERECARVRGVEAAPARIESQASGMVLTDAYLKAVQDKYVAVALSQDVDESLAAQSDPNLRHLLEVRDEWLAPAYVVDAAGEIVDKAGTDERMRSREIEQIRRDVEAFVLSHARAFGIEHGSAAYKRIESAFIEAELRVNDARRARRSGTMFGETYRPADASAPRLKPQSAWTLKKISEEYLSKTGSGASWAHKVEIAVELFEQFLEKPTPISAITRDHIREFLDLLAVCPQRSSMRFPNMTLKQAVEANRALARPYPLISANTIRDNHFAVIRKLFGYACGELDAISIDPTNRIKIRGARKRAGRSSHFETDELVDLFNLPLFAGCMSTKRTLLPGTVKLDDHQFWTPLLMLFGGIRPSEIAQLSVSDVKLNRDCPSLSILTEYDPNDPEDRPWVLAFKTENARRDVPLHPTLIELGFSRYVDRVRQTKSERLFPEWKASQDPRKLYSGATWVRRFNEVLIPSITAKKPKPSIYSLRHTFKTQMAVCRVPAQYQNQVMGHSGFGMDPTYLKTMPIREVYREIAKVEYPGLDLSHLVR